ncbi:MAG: SAM-dependent methyltransferase [Lentisphaerae bacterium GWF2_44_16]|nr:MAG: SAM-dependent methyltransferase [Lentisphaerae bacterium GWF2_44_16]
MKLNEVVPWGRNADEYIRMFSLSDADLKGKILGCGDGPASFNTEMTEKGRNVISVDPIYEFSAEKIEERINHVYDIVIGQVKKDPSPYVWNFFKSPDEMGQCRLKSMKRFLSDYEKGRSEGRYKPESLPELSFPDKVFDLCLSSHFLFLYSGNLGLDFHIKAISEMLRVSREARIFPLLDHYDNKESAFTVPVMEYFNSKGYKAETLKVDYEFQIGGNHMMKIKSH